MSRTAITSALIADLIADPDALEQLAAALAPRLAAVSPNVDDNAGLTTAQAARRAGVHERTIRRALTAGTLRGHVVANRWRIQPDDLAAWLGAGAPTSTTPTHTNGRARRGATAGADAIATAGRAA